ncbi:MAG: hypothetical protein LBU69_00550 [Deltaproteobacteria bacterium]|nr:hypothetical protein [Deltaproteobacteria bacterium]
MVVTVEPRAGTTDYFVGALSLGEARVGNRLAGFGLGCRQVKLAFVRQALLPRDTEDTLFMALGHEKTLSRSL